MSFIPWIRTVLSLGSVSQGLTKGKAVRPVLIPIRPSEVIPVDLWTYLTASTDKYGKLC